VFITISNSLLPVFLIILLGIFIGKQKLISESSQKELNKLTFWVCLPMLILPKILNSDISSETGKIFFIPFMGMLTAIFLSSFLAHYVFKMKKGSCGAFIQASFRGNLLFVSLPIILFLLQDFPVTERNKLEATLTIALVPLIIAYNIAAVLILVIHNQEKEKHPLHYISKNLARNPIVLSCLVALGMKYLHLSLPTALGVSCQTVGQAALPLALLGIGNQISHIKIHTRIPWIILASFIKLIIAPFTGYVIAQFIHVSGIELRIIMLLLAAPTAVTSYVMAEQMNNDANLAASAVAFSTITSMFTFAIILILPL